MRTRRPWPSEEDGLQTDVMRFMAIIAFCLIAILALVRHVEPESTEAEPVTTATTDTDDLALTPEPEPLPDPMVARQPEPSRGPEPRVPREPEPQPLPDPVVAREPEQAPAPGAERTSEEPVSEAVTAADIEAPTEEGLTLRFASDSDFLRLVNSGRLEVFAFDDDSALRLVPGLTLEPVAAPGALYELLPETLPDSMRAALSGAHGDYDRYRWGMRMPARMEAQIRNHLRSATRGALIIDRHGDVRHETDG